MLPQHLQVIRSC